MKRALIFTYFAIKNVSRTNTTDFEKVSIRVRKYTRVHWSSEFSCLSLICLKFIKTVCTNAEK